MDGRTVEWLWKAAALLDQTSSSARLISRHLREVSSSGRDEKGRLLRPAQDEFGVPELCPQCLTPWSVGYYSLKLVPLNHNKKKTRSLQKLLRKDPSTLNNFQVALLKRIKLKPASLMRITCKMCKKITKVYLAKSNNSCLEKTQIEIVKEVSSSGPALIASDPLPKKKRKKRKKDALCGLKLSAVSQVKQAKVWSQPSSNIVSVSKGSDKNSTNPKILDSQSTITPIIYNNLHGESGSNINNLPLVNPKKVIASHDKIQKSLEQIFSNLEKDFDSNQDLLSVTHRKNLAKSNSNEVAVKSLNSSYKNSPLPDDKKVESDLKINKSPNPYNQQEISSSDQLSKCSSEKKKNKRLGITEFNNSNKRLKTVDNLKNTSSCINIKSNKSYLEVNTPEKLTPVNKTNKSIKGVSIKQLNNKKINLFSQPSDNILQREVCTISNGKTQNGNQIYDRCIDRETKKTCYNDNGIKTATNNGKGFSNPKSKLPTLTESRKSIKNQKKKSKNNKRGKNIKMKKSNNRAFAESNYRESLSISDLLSLT